MKVSIITVSYNRDTTISDTFDSVLRQDYDNIEYIVIDGMSTDNTVNIIKKYEPLFKGRMKWISEEDSGLYDAMNKGLQMATGDIVGIINSDDFYYKENIIGTIVENFQKMKVASVYGDVRFVSDSNLNKTIRYYSSKIWHKKLFKFGFMPAHPTFFTYKKYFEEFGYYKTDYKIAADFELLVRFFKNGNFTSHYMNTDILKMRIGGVSSGGWRSNLTLNKEIIRACKENGIYTNLFILGFKYFYKIWEFVLPKQ